MSSTPSPLEATTASSAEEQIANMVPYRSTWQCKFRLGWQIFKPVWQCLLAASILDMQGRLEALSARVMDMAQVGCWTGQRPSISPPEKYDGVLKTLVDQFVCQVEAVAEFEVFQDDHQKILWAQLYLTGSAQAWSCVITTRLKDEALNPWCFQWVAWLVDFKAAFGMCKPVQDMLNGIMVLQQGS
ncbi:hypothetical protein C0993_012441, partial [Termitomyces sp. T159_Od127]